MKHSFGKPPLNIIFKSTLTGCFFYGEFGKRQHNNGFGVFGAEITGDKAMNKIQIVEKNIDELKRYKNNPRINDKAVSYVANSIKRFGFLNPIIIDKNDEIIAGDTRLKACKQLGIKEIPCIYADDLTDEEVKAFRLADNKVSEIADWDYSKLDLEMESILDIDMLDFGFEDFTPGSIIDDLLSDDMFQSVSGTDKDYFSISFVFKKEYEEDVNRLIKEKGKDYIVDAILNLTREEG